MGIFGGKRARAAAEFEMLPNPMWRAEPGLITCAASHLDDDGCASSDACGTRFLLDGNPGVTLVVWVYPCYAAADGDDVFEPGYCTEYRAGEWTWKQYAPGPGWSRGLDVARRAARDLAEALAGTVHQAGGETDLLGFDWDGTPW